MDPAVIALMIPIVAILSGSAIKAYTMYIAEQRRTGGHEMDGRLEAIEHEVAALRTELNETQERLDFTERLLAQGGQSKRVEGEAR